MFVDVYGLVVYMPIISLVNVVIDCHSHPSNTSLVVYNYEPQKASYPFLRVQLGDVVQVLEENAGWYRGFCVRDKHSKGVFPSSHVQLKDCTLQNPG